MGINSEQANQIIVDMMTGKPPSVTGAEADAFRERAKKEIEEIEKKGGIVQMPND